MLARNWPNPKQVDKIQKEIVFNTFGSHLIALGEDGPNRFFMATDAATWVPQNCPSGSGRALTLIWDPCPHGLLELQNSTAIFYIFPCASCAGEMHFPFEQPVLASCLGSHKTCVPGCRTFSKCF